MVTGSRPRRLQFMRRVQNRPALRRKGSLVVFAQLLVVASGVGVGGGGAFLAYRYVTHNSTFRLHRLVLDAVPDELRGAVREHLASAENTNLLTADLEPLQARLREIPQIQAATLRRVLPDSVEVHVELRRAWGLLLARDESYAVSEDGVVLRPATAADSSLPRLRLDVDLGPRLDARRRVVSVAPEARWFGVAVRIVDWLHTIAPGDLDHADLLLAPEGVSILLEDWRILLGDDTHLDAKAANLRALMNRSMPRPGSLVDLRFRDMVVVRDPDAEPQEQE